MEDALVKLIELVSNVAPHVWKIAVRQAYVQGYIALMDVVFCVVGILAGIRLWTWGLRGVEKDDWLDNPLHPLAIVVSVVVVIALPFIAWYNIDVAVGNLANPEYVAIKILLQTAGVK